MVTLSSRVTTLRTLESLPYTSKLAVGTALRVAEAIRLFSCVEGGGTVMLMTGGGGMWVKIAALAQSGNKRPASHHHLSNNGTPARVAAWRKTSSVVAKGEP